MCSNGRFCTSRMSEVDYTVCKFDNFPATHILCEINFSKPSRVSIMTIRGLKNVENYNFRASAIMKIDFT